MYEILEHIEHIDHVYHNRDLDKVVEFEDEVSQVAEQDDRLARMER